MIFENSSESDDNKSVIYNNDSSYISSNFMESYSSRNTSCNVSRNNSLKSQSYMDNIREDIMKNKLKKKNKIALQLQRKNFKLKYKLVLQELKTQEIKTSLYKMNYRLVLEEFKN